MSRFRSAFVLAALLFLPALPLAQPAAAEWITLLDGTTLQGWNQVGTANWAVVDGAVQATTGPGFLVTPRGYANFELKAEAWVSNDANSGIFFRGSDAKTITPATGYEVNLFDQRPDPKYRTGAIVDVAEPAIAVNAGGHWTTVEILANGPHLVVALNGTKTIDVMHDLRTSGVIALQSTTGVVKFRSVRIRLL